MPLAGFRAHGLLLPALRGQVASGWSDATARCSAPVRICSGTEDDASIVNGWALVKGEACQVGVLMYGARVLLSAVQPRGHSRGIQMLWAPPRPGSAKYVVDSLWHGNCLIAYRVEGTPPGHEAGSFGTRSWPAEARPKGRKFGALTRIYPRPSTEFRGQRRGVFNT